jgi:hypothetical protein
VLFADWGASLFMVFVMAFLLILDLFTGADGGVHLVFLLFFGILFVFFWGLSKLW